MKSGKSRETCLTNYTWYISHHIMPIVIEINKNLKFKKGVGIAIKSKETSSKLAI